MYRQLTYPFQHNRDYRDIKFLSMAKLDPEFVKNFILSFGYKQNVMDYRRMTPLGFVARYGLLNKEVFEMALERRANIFYHLSMREELSIAGVIVSSKDVDCIRVLLNHVKPYTPIDYEGNTVLHYVAYYEIFEILSESFNSSSFLDYRNNYERTPLHLAASKGNIRMVRKLLQLGANINTVDYQGNSALMLASTIECRFGDIVKNTMQLLISYGADVNSRDKCGATILASLCKRHEKNLDLFRLLLNAGADPTIRDYRGASPLHYLCCTDDVDCSILLDCGVDIDAKDGIRYSPLKLAVSMGNIKNIETLLAYGATIDNFMEAFRTYEPDSNVKKLLSTYIYLQKSREPRWTSVDAEELLSLINTHELFHDHSINVLDQIVEMRKYQIGNTDKTMWHIAAATIDELIEIFKNEELRSEIMKFEHFKIFKYFDTCITKKTQRALKIRALFSDCVDKLPSILNQEMSVECREKIVDMIGTSFLQRVAHSE